MKVITILIAAGLMFTAAGQSTSTDAKTSETRKVAKTPESPTIPSDASPLPDGSFRYVDKDGKKWIYRNTPFGVSKAEERAVVPVAARIEDDPTRTEDLGDSVRFTRPTPFGPKVWTSKKGELESYEKSLWDRDSKKSSNDDAKTRAAADQD